MKVRIYSDLHLEFGVSDAPFTTRGAEELVVLAGDIAVGTDGVRWAKETFPHVPVVYVLGNHEFYHHDLGTLLQECKALAHGSNVHVLDREAFDFQGIRVLGATLWTDFECFGEARAGEAMEWADQTMSDFWCIRERGLNLTPMRTTVEFGKSSRWLDVQIRASDRPLLVVTHHAPTMATLAPFYAGQISNAAFHSKLDRLVRPPVKLWVHGHTHFNSDVPVNGVRVVSNQYGYPDEGTAGFRLDGLFELGADDVVQ